MNQSYPELVSTGNAALDEILHGGLPRHHMFLVQGEAGTGKTTLGIQFLLEGARNGEKVLLISLSEVVDDLHEIARSHGWSLDGIDIYELAPAEAAQQFHLQQTIFPTAEVELNELTTELIEVLKQKQPARVLFDSVTEIRLLSEDPRRYRHQMLTLSKVLDDINSTVLMTERLPLPHGERVLDSIVHGIIRLERRVPEYGSTRRHLEVSKMRGMHYREGWHDYRITTGGLEIYPRVAESRFEPYAHYKQLASGVDELDQLIGGGLEFGSAVLLTGTSGTGKSSIANQFVYAGLQQGMAAAVLLSDERPATLFKRSIDLGIDFRPFYENELLTVRQVETGEVTPGEVAAYVRRLVERDVKIVLIDSLTGYMRAMPEENLVLSQMHDLLNYLSRRGILTLMVVTKHGLLEEGVVQDLDMSYLADTVVLFRHFEADGALRQVMSVVKKRHSGHERTLREVRVGRGGIVVGQPLIEFRGVLTGNPEYRGGRQALLDV